MPVCVCTWHSSVHAVSTCVRTNRKSAGWQTCVREKVSSRLLILRPTSEEKRRLGDKVCAFVVTVGNSRYFQFLCGTTFDKILTWIDRGNFASASALICVHVVLILCSSWGSGNIDWKPRTKIVVFIDVSVPTHGGSLGTYVKYFLKLSSSYYL